MRYTKKIFTALVFGAFLLIFAVPAGAQVGQYWIVVDPAGNMIPGGAGVMVIRTLFLKISIF